MKDYVNYTPEELAQDDYFVRWVRTSNIHAEAFWQHWMDTYPFKRKDVEDARQLVLAVYEELHPGMDNGEIADLRSAIIRQVLDVEEARRPRIRYTRWLAAASAGILLMLGGYWFTKGNSGVEAMPEMAAQAVTGLIEVKNMSEEIKAIFLSDGSSVTLKKGSKITYPARFAADSRKIVLDGEAFFEVTKDKDRPFFVITSDVFTKVLGTSFNVRAYSSDKEVAVLVKTGKVSVYRTIKNRETGKATACETEGVVLNPNQQAVFLTANDIEVPVKKEIRPQPVKAGFPNSNDIKEMLFEYKDESAGTIFRQLEVAYNIKIDYKGSDFDNCPVTASLTGEPLFVKLDLICKAIRARYHVMDEKIRISGKGCS